MNAKTKDEIREEFREKYMDDVIIDYKGKKYLLKKILDSEESWQKYCKGSDVFKKAVERGILSQLQELDRLFNPLKPTK